MTETAETSAEAPSGGAVKYVLIALTLVFLGVGAYVVFALPAKTPPLRYRTLAVQLGDPEQVQVTFEVTKDPAAEAECQVTAVGDDREIVNRLIGIRIPPAARDTTRHSVTVRTDQLATDATVTYCAITRAG